MCAYIYRIYIYTYTGRPLPPTLPLTHSSSSSSSSSHTPSAEATSRHMCDAIKHAMPSSSKNSSKAEAVVKTVVQLRPPAGTCAMLLSTQCLLKSSSKNKVEAVVKNSSTAEATSRHMRDALNGSKAAVKQGPQWLCLNESSNRNNSKAVVKQQ